MSPLIRGLVMLFFGELEKSRKKPPEPVYVYVDTHDVITTLVVWLVIGLGVLAVISFFIAH